MTLPRFLEIDQATLSDADREELARVREKALEWCNGVIAEYHGRTMDHLLKGQPGHPYHCALAETLNAGLRRADQDAFDISRMARVRHEAAEVGLDTIQHTPESQSFSAYFDAGLYADLVEGD